jgi:hypothetical protein
MKNNTTKKPMKIERLIYSILDQLAIVSLLRFLERCGHMTDCISEAGWRYLEDLENKD